MSEIPHHLPPGTYLRGDTYRIVRFIAAGGFGCTYEAEHVLLRKRIAIKEFFMQGYCNREADTCHVTMSSYESNSKWDFINGAWVFSRLHHEGIVSVSDVFEENGTAYYVMDYVEGQSLAERCKNNPLPEKDAIDYISRVCEAAAYVHDHQRLHLDIKPGNVMVEASGRIILMDVGMSRPYAFASGENRTIFLSDVSDYPYVPGEQLAGEFRNYLPATDIYSLGATLYFLLTGKNPPSVVARNKGAMLSFPTETSATTRNVVERAMDFSREERPQSVREFMALLNATVQPTVQSGPAAPVPPRVTPVEPVTQDEPKKKSRKLLKGVLMGVILVLYLALGVLLTKGYSTIIIVLCLALIALFIKICSNSSGNEEQETLEDSIKNDSVVTVEKPVLVEPKPTATHVWAAKPVPAEEMPVVEEEELNKVASVTGTHAGHDYVDFGLSVKWATCNVGAFSPSGYGNYYAWGETNTKIEYTWRNFKAVDRSLNDIRGNSDYDAARANWGGSWRLPTKDEFRELLDNCNCQWTIQNGVRGMCFTSKKNGNSIFFPAAGYLFNFFAYYKGESGFYWSSTRYVGDKHSPYGLHFLSRSSASMAWHYRYRGCPVRPVLDRFE